MEFDLDSSIEVLARTPGALRSLLGGLADRWVRGTEGADTFSAFDVVGHLIDGEETDWIPRARIILAKGEDPRFEPYDRFRHRARNAGRPLASLLDELEALRAANLALLRSWRLAAADLDLPGMHPSLGRVTLRELLAAWVVHDLGHIAQIGTRDGEAVRGSGRPVGAVPAGPLGPPRAAVVATRCSAAPPPGVAWEHPRRNRTRRRTPAGSRWDRWRATCRGCADSC